MDLDPDDNASMVKELAVAAVVVATFVGAVVTIVWWGL